MREKELNIARENVSALIRRKFVFDSEDFLNKTVFLTPQKLTRKK